MSTFAGFNMGNCAACGSVLDGGYVSAPGGKYHAHCIGPTATGSLRLEDPRIHLSRPSGDQELESLKKENAKLRRIEEEWGAALDKCHAEHGGLFKENQELSRALNDLNQGCLELEAERDQLRSDLAQAKVALANVSGALFDSGVVVPEEEWRWGGVIRQLTKERDEAQREGLAWKDAARFHCGNEEYYRGLVDQIGEMLGPAAKTADDGKLGPEVLRAKVPEVVAATLDALRAKVERLTEALSGAINHLEDVLWSQSPSMYPGCPPSLQDIENNIRCGLSKIRAALSSSPPPVAGANSKPAHEGLRCPPGESAVGTARTTEAATGERQEGEDARADSARSVPGPGTGEQVGREPSPMAEHSEESRGTFKCPKCWRDWPHSEKEHLEDALGDANTDDDVASAQDALDAFMRPGWVAARAATRRRKFELQRELAGVEDQLRHEKFDASPRPRTFSLEEMWAAVRKVDLGCDLVLPDGWWDAFRRALEGKS